MDTKFKITKNENSKISEVDFDNIPFGKIFSDHMFTADYKDGEWGNFQIVPFGPIQIHPACLALHYGQSIFEGMKATKSYSGDPLLFRPEMHATRINASARRMAMPEFPEDVFVEAIHAIVGLDQKWIPPAEGSALYIRPFMFANGEYIGVGPSDTYKFVIFTGPVGPYYPKPIGLVAEEFYVRAAVGGTGEAKACGNYAGSLLPTELAKQKGYDQVLWLDGKEYKYVQEAGTMNLFFVIDDVVITPATDGAILKGITRDSLLAILDSFGYKIEVRPITIDEIVKASKNGLLQEAFGAGTAVVVANIDRIKYKDNVLKLPVPEKQKVANFLRNEINGIRSQKKADEFDWIVPVKAPEAIKA
ncbi:MAG: branched-chain amino acid aminotransferase [Saprospiraceae bacterium]|nr:branched-chain amino acid aminotransferase [Saprospiraceae bacterium]